MLSDEQRSLAEETARRLWQGDLLAAPVAVVLEAPESSLIDASRELETVDEADIWSPAALSITSGWTAIVTQTCDIVRSLNDVAYLQVMPLVELSESEWEGALNGRRGTLFSLPPVDDLPIAFPAIDCALSFPVAKAALAHERVQTLSTSLDPATRILLSSWLMRRVGRYAFPDELEHYVLAPLREKITSSIGKNSRAGHLASCLIGVWSTTAWTASASIIFIVDANRLQALGHDVDLDKAVAELLAPARKRLGTDGISVQVTASARTLDGVSAFTLLVEHRQVDLDALPVGGFTAKHEIESLAGATEASTAPE